MSKKAFLLKKLLLKELKEIELVDRNQIYLKNKGNQYQISLNTY